MCVRACVAIISSRAVWKLRNGLRLRGNFEIGKEQCTRKNEIRNSCYTVAEGENFREAKENFFRRDSRSLSAVCARLLRSLAGR